MNHLTFIALFGILSLLSLALHFLTKQHRNIFLVFGVGFLVLALSQVPSYINAYAAENAPENLLSISDSLDFYGTVLGLLSSFLLSYIAFRISRNDHKRNNSSCITVQNLQCKPILISDHTFNRVMKAQYSRRGPFRGMRYAWHAARKEPTPIEEKNSLGNDVRSGFNTNMQQFAGLPRVGKLSNERLLHLTWWQHLRRRALSRKLQRLSIQKKGRSHGFCRRYRLALTAYKLQRYEDYTTKDAQQKNKVLVLKWRNCGPSVLQQIKLSFPGNNYVFECFLVMTPDEEKCNFLLLPDDCNPNDVIHVTFVSCYGERTFGEFKLTPVKDHAPLPNDFEKAEEAHRARHAACDFYSIKHYHYYGSGHPESPIDRLLSVLPTPKEN